MRILKLLFFSCILVAVVSGISFLLVREVLLSLAVTQVKSGVTVLKQLKLSPGMPAVQCTSSNLANVPLVPVEAIQLAFTSATDFQAEVICETPLREPQVVATFTLPPFVKKMPGTAGLLWGKNSGIVLELWGRHRSVLLTDQEVSVSHQVVNVSQGQPLIATCQGYGFSCCGTDAAVGQGEQTDQVRDCPKSCYASCLARPVVLSFTSQPFFDPQTRTLTVGASEAVTFNYVVDFGATQAGTLTFDFGDGATEMFTDAVGTVEHLFSCPADSCEFPVKVFVSDTQGTRSIDTTISQMKVLVKN